MRVDPETGAVWILRSGASTALRLARTADLVPLEGVARAETLAVGQNGFVYVCDGRVIAVLDAAGRRERSSAFNGLACGTVLDVARRFSNFDPAFDGNRWNDLHYTRAFKEDRKRRASRGTK